MVVMLAGVGIVSGICYWASREFPSFFRQLWAAGAVLCVIIVVGWLYWIYLGVTTDLFTTHL